jgi:hypothetical protein
MEQPREALKKLNVSAEMPEFRIMAVRIRPSPRGWMNRRYKSADYGIWRFAQAVDRSYRGRKYR